MAMMGSAVWSGRLPLETAHGLTDRAGVSVRDELQRAGLPTGEPIARQAVKASLEVHIEQGPVLEQKGRTIGVLVFSGQALRAPDERLQQAARVIGSQVGQFLQRKHSVEAHLRHQEKIARFGQSALGKREPPELIADAVQSVLEGLGADAVAYVEPGPAEHRVVVRALVGVAGSSSAQAEASFAPQGPLAPNWLMPEADNGPY